MLNFARFNSFKIHFSFIIIIFFTLRLFYVLVSLFQEHGRYIKIKQICTALLGL